MLRTTINWYKPEEKTPENGIALALCDTGYIVAMNVYNGHFNCSSDDLATEIEVVAWANIPNGLKIIAEEAWSKRNV